MVINFSGTVSSLSYPTIAGLRSALIAQLSLDNAPPGSVEIHTTFFGSIEWHYDVNGTVSFPDALGWGETELVNEVVSVLASLTGYQYTATANTPQPALSDVVADPINGMIHGAESALDSVKAMGGSIAGSVTDAVKGLQGDLTSTAKAVERDVLIVAGLVIVGIVVIAFSPQVSKAARVLR